MRLRAARIVGGPADAGRLGGLSVDDRVQPERDRRRRSGPGSAQLRRPRHLPRRHRPRPPSPSPSPARPCPFHYQQAFSQSEHPGRHPGHQDPRRLPARERLQPPIGRDDQELSHRSGRWPPRHRAGRPDSERTRHWSGAPVVPLAKLGLEPRPADGRPSPRSQLRPGLRNCRRYCPRRGTAGSSRVAKDLSQPDT